MKAVQMTRHGGPDVLRYVDLPRPEPKDGELLLEVAAIGVNPADLKWRSGLFASFAPLRFPHIPGYDVAGTVEQSAARAAAMTDSLRQGAYAECVAIPMDRFAAVPDSLCLDVAAAVPTPGLTGVQLIENQLDAQPGQRILITGAAGMVGRFAIHAARRRGCEVVAAVRRDRRSEALALGAQDVIILGDERWHGPPVDAVVDTIGGVEVSGLCAAVRAPGAIVTVATTPIPSDDLAVKPIFYAVRTDAARLAQLLQSVAAGEVTVPVSARMRLEDAAEAHRLIEGGQLRGKLILLP